jgi:hypothetical protein
MMDEKLIEIINKKLEAQIESFRSVLCDGGAKSYDHYKELSGTIRGLQLAQYELGDLVRKLKDSDDD